MLEDPDTETEVVTYHVILDADSRKILLGDTIRFLKEVSLDELDIDLLLKRMDREIFEDFRRSFDFSLVNDPSAIIFSIC
ncbi:MAG: hypothetical protein HXS44_06185 [Theionarchaea archaeon]|nr:hypothetical protein [Theionarchaea archaeon]